jgi:uncharacterized membrane protein YeiH
LRGVLYTFELFAICVCAITGVLAAEGKRVDLFGVIVLAVVTAFGGGTVRDLLLGDLPVFWLRNPHYLLTATVTAIATFVIARYRPLPRTVLLVADAFGLALFTIAGTKKALAFGVLPSAAVSLGVITGVAGGMLRDVLTGVIPLVFQKEIYLYATAALCGAVAYALLAVAGLAEPYVTLLGTGVTLALRLAGIRWKLGLPLFHTRQP